MKQKDYFMLKLKPPLEENELQYYFNKLKNGDEKAKNIILEHNIRLIINFLNTHYENFNYEFEDLFSISLIAMMKAINTYEINKNVKFATYAVKCINNEILMFHRREKKHNNVDSLDRKLTTENEELRIIDTLYEEDTFTTRLEKKELYYKINGIIELLPEMEKCIIKMYFGFDEKIYKQKDIAIMFDISQAFVSKIIKKTLKQIKNELIKLQLIDYEEKVYKKNI